MPAVDRMRLRNYEFAVETGSFRYITDSDIGPGWDFNFTGPCLNDDAENPVFPYGFKLLAEAAPIPLAKAADYSGVVISLPLSFDAESGEPLFGLNVWEEHEVSDVTLRFAERAGNRYRIEITGTVADTVFGEPAPLELCAWAEELPDHSYG
jgi:hypothetical protein